MSFNIKNISALGRVIYPSLLWNLPDKNNTLYLTFDDGPIPEITPWVLSLLKDFDAKGTFFCIGENVAKYPEVYKQILAEGHSIGNHTFNHLNGWDSSLQKYVENVLLAENQIIKYPLESIVKKNSNLPSEDCTRNNVNLFRPPYGKIKPGQIKKLQQKGYRIVMWDVLSEDYNQSLSAEKCFENVVKHAKSGSIIVFHDSLKASANLQEVLPKVLKFYKEKGFEFKGL